MNESDAGRTARAVATGGAVATSGSFELGERGPVDVASHGPAEAALRDAVAGGLLRCPHCREVLGVGDGWLGCERGHRYDVARQGYVSLLPPGGSAHRGDTAEMVAARETFLGGGHYTAIVAAVAETADAVADAAGAVADGAGAVAEAAGAVAAARTRWVLDVGAGTGHHLAAVLEALPGWSGIAADASRYALRRAARAHPRIAAIGCDAWRQLPVPDAAVGVVLNVFAPRPAPEIARVLAPDGALIVVTPAPDHLHQLVAAAGMLTVAAGKQARLLETLAPELGAVDSRPLSYDMALDRAALRSLIAMSPTAHHLTPAELGRRVASLPEPMTVTASVVVGIYRRR